MHRLGTASLVTGRTALAFLLSACLAAALGTSSEAHAPLALGQEAQTAQPAASAEASSAKVWVGRAPEFEEYLRTAAIARVADVPIGVTRPRRAYFKPGGPAASAIVKDLPPGRKLGFWESYTAEIAAYEMDKLLGLDMVPVTVERRVEGKKMSAQLWLEHCKLLKELPNQNAPDSQAWNRQVFRQRVFDNLIGNIDRNAGNLLVDRAWNLILIDHSRAFTETDKMPFLADMRAIDRPLFERLKALDEATVAARIGPWLFGGRAKRALLERRRRIVEHFEKLAAEKGEGLVFLP
jgi:hypothetical protein